MGEGYASAEQRKDPSDEEFPELALCDHHWKIEQLAKDQYPTYRKNHPWPAHWKHAQPEKKERAKKE